MFDVGLAGEHLYGRWLFVWLSLVVSYFMLSFFPRGVLGGIWGLVWSFPPDLSYLLSYTQDGRHALIQ